MITKFVRAELDRVVQEELFDIKFTAGSAGAMQVKFLAQGNNSKQQCLGIEPGSVGSQADPKPLKPQLPHFINRQSIIHLLLFV